MGANLRMGLVIDLECTCWQTPEEQGNQPMEIIEIGVAALAYKTRQILDKASIVVKPRFSKVSNFCTELTGWKQSDIDAGLDIVDALKEFENRFKPSQHHVWFSCGEFDKVKLSSTQKGGIGDLYKISSENNPFEKMRAHVNIKTLFAIKHRNGREMGLKRMLAACGETFEGNHHNGMDDAVNIAKIVNHVLS